MRDFQRSPFFRDVTVIERGYKMDRHIRALKKKLTSNSDSYEVMDALEDLQGDWSWSLSGEPASYWRARLLSEQAPLVLQAMNSFSKLGPLCLLIESELTQVVRETPHWFVKCQGLKLLGKIRKRLGEGQDAILEALADSHWKVRGQAAKSLRKGLKTDRVVAALKSACQDDDPYPRKHALKTLSQLSPNESVPFLQNCLSDPDQSVVLAAVRGFRRTQAVLSKSNRDVFLEILEKIAINHDFNDFLTPVTKLLSRDVSSLSVELASKLIQHDDVRRSLALKIFSEKGSDSHVQMIVTALECEYDTDTTLEGIRTLAKISSDFSELIFEIDFTNWYSPTEVITEVGRLLNDSSRLIKALFASEDECAQGLGVQLARTTVSDPSKHIKNLLEILERRDSGEELRGEIIEFLGYCESSQDEAIDALIRFIEENQDEWLVTEGAMALALFGRQAFRGLSSLRERLAYGLRDKWEEDSLRICAQAFLRIGGNKETIMRLREARRQELEYLASIKEKRGPQKKKRAVAKKKRAVAKRKS